jgi:hypothetical protein
MGEYLDARLEASVQNVPYAMDLGVVIVLKKVVEAALPLALPDVEHLPVPRVDIEVDIMA